MQNIPVKHQAGFWSLTDQGFVSLGNFLTNIFLARTLVAADYGVFALIYGLIILLNSFHSCVVSYPLTLKGATSDADALKKYTRSALLFTVFLSIPFGGIVFGASVVLGRSTVAVCAIFALVCWELQETLRRSLMSHLRHGEAIWGDAFSYVGQAALIYLCVFMGHVSLKEVFGIIAITSICAAALQAMQLGLSLRGKGGLLEPARDFWDVGRLPILANAAVSISAVAFPWILALRGTQDSGSFQSLVNLVGITNPIMLGISNLIVPATTRVNREAGIGSAWRSTAKHGLQGAIILLPYYLALLVWPHLALRVFYGAHSSYLNLEFSLRILVIGYALAYVSHIFSSFFYGLEGSRTVLNAQTAGALAAIVVGLPLARVFMVSGACVGLTLGYGVQVIAFFLYFRTRFREATTMMARYVTPDAGALVRRKM